jgi:hypothetical protein
MVIISEIDFFWMLLIIARGTNQHDAALFNRRQQQ